jgi:outer membrane murein-binding lipoprotein Lpp
MGRIERWFAENIIPIMVLAAVMAAALLLTGCAQRPLAEPTVDIMPTIKPYTKEQTRRVSAELKQCEAKTDMQCRQTRAFLRDYLHLRDKVRASREALK